MDSKVHEFIQKTLAQDENAEQSFREYVQAKARAILYPAAGESKDPVQQQQEQPTE